MSKYKQYTLRTGMADFTLDSLALGAMEVLGDAFSFTKSYFEDVSDDAMKQLSINKLKYYTGSARSNFMKAPAVLLETSFDQQAASGRRLSNDSCQLLIDEGHGELIETNCTCRAYKNNHFDCPHVHQLLMAYLFDRDGKDAFRGTPLEEKLKTLSGFADPLAPGCLQKTSPLLREMFMKQDPQSEKDVQSAIWDQMRPDNQEKNRSLVDAYAPISLELHFFPTSQNLGIELKAGSQKHYVVKDTTTLFEAYKNDHSYAFGSKCIIPAGRCRYHADWIPVMDYLIQLYDIYYKNNILYQMFGNSHNNYRTITLLGANLDGFMDLIAGRKVICNITSSSKVFCNVDWNASITPIAIKQQTYGANLQIPETTYLGTGIRWCYILQGNTIKRLPLDQRDMWEQLAKTSADKKDLFIREQDLPEVLEGLKEVISFEKELVSNSFPLSAYTLPEPEWNLYLDLPQSDAISCEVKVMYPDLKEPGKEAVYSLFDRKTDADKRNMKAEHAWAEQVCPMFTSYDPEEMKLYLSFTSNDDLFSFLTDGIDALGKLGTVLVSDRLKRLKVIPSGTVDVGISVVDGNLAMSVKAEQLSTDEMAQLLSRYNKKTNYTRLKNGSFITIDPKDAPVWDMLSEAYQTYGKNDPEAMKIPLFRAYVLNEMLQERDAFALNKGETYQQLIRSLSEDVITDYEVPESLKEVLRPYQVDGFQWISMLKENGFGGILADDMGLGKTLQVLSFLLSQKELHGFKRTLIVAPASLVYNWQKEIRTFSPDLRCAVIAGTVSERRKIINGINENQDTEVYITSYDLLKRDLNLYDEIHFDHQVLDEAQYIKNQNTQAAKSVRLLQADFRLALSGTPIENKLSELWSVFDYLMPGFLYSYHRFRMEYEGPIVNDHNQIVLEKLRLMVHPFILRRLKKDVLKDLPDKLEETVAVRLIGEQRKLYDAYANRLRMYLDKQSDREFREHKLEILAELTKLRQLCCGPGLLLDNYKGPNGKMDACMELIKQAVDSGHKVLVFSQFTSNLDELEKALKKQQLKRHRIDGSVSKERRMEQVDSFATDDVPVFLISLKAGGTGLNLTAADIVIHYDPWWNAAAQNQATDRTHRIGQTNSVTVYKLIAENTIEEQIVNLQETKTKLADDLLSGEGVGNIMIDKNELLKILM